MVNYIESGDIFALQGISSFAHGCNCAGAMGKGIAVQFKAMFPEMYAEYHAMCKAGKYNPGDVFDYNYGKGHIYNLATQVSWRTCAKIEYISESIKRMLELARKEGVQRIAMPAIGAGLGGLKWEDVKEAIDSVAVDFPEIELHVVERYSPAVAGCN